MATQKTNATAVLNLLKSETTLTDLAATLSVTKATATRYVKELLQAGTVVQVGVQNTGGRGRPSPLYRAM